MENITENIRNYVKGWNQASPETIGAIFSKCCAAGITYTDKATPQFTGIDRLVELVTGSYQKVPGRTFSVLTEPECFDGKAYYTWGVDIPGKGQLAGHDFMEYNEEGLITRIVGFLPVI